MAMNQASTEDLKNKILEKEAGKGNPPEKKADQARIVQAQLEKMLPELKKALPRHITAERIARIALTACRMTPKLMELSMTNPASFFGAVMQAAQLGLEPNLLGSCYLIPYGSQVQFIIGYQGMIDLANRSGELSYIYCKTVHKNDFFKQALGTSPKIEHEPALENRGEIIGFYACAVLKNGSIPFEFMSVEDINKIRDAHAGRGRDGNINKIWVDHYEAMSKKTVIKRLIKYLPVSVEFKEKIEMDGRNIIDLEKSEFSISESMDTEFSNELM